MTHRSLLVLALTSALAVFGVLTVTILVEDAWRHFVDSAIYVLTAKSLAAGEGYRYLGQPFFVRPPGLSLLLAPLVGEPYDFRTLNLFMQISAAATFLAVALALRRLQGALRGTLVTLLFAIQPLSLQTFNRILSEFPFMALFFSAAWLLLPDRAGRQVGWGRGLAGAVLLAASCYVRSVGLLAVPALALADLPRRDGRRWQGAALGLLALLLYVPWMLHASSAAETAERPSTQLLMFDYSTALLREDPSDPSSAYLSGADWIERVQRNATDIAENLGYVLLGRPRPPPSWIDGRPRAREGGIAFGDGLLATLLAAAMLVTCWTRRSFLDATLLAYALLMLTYFTFVDRLLLPILPLLLSSAVHATDLLARRVGERLGAPHLAAWALTVLALGSGCLSLLRMGEALALNPRRVNEYRADMAAAEWIRAHTPADARILHEKGPIIGLLSAHRTYTYRNLPGPWPQGCPEVDYVLLGPQPEEIEAAVSAASIERGIIPVEWFGRQAGIRVYRMGELPDDP